jgi:hypothetical protein
MEAALRIYDETPGAERRPATTLRLASERVTARDLIRRRVEQEVAAYNGAKDEVFQGLVQPSKSEQLLNGFKLKMRRPLDAEEQVGVALAAFEKNGFVLLFDDRQIDDLDEAVIVTPESFATFIKLTPLVGG